MPGRVFLALGRKHLEGFDAAGNKRDVMAKSQSWPLCCSVQIPALRPNPGLGLPIPCSRCSQTRGNRQHGNGADLLGEISMLLPAVSSTRGFSLGGVSDRCLASA